MVTNANHGGSGRRSGIGGPHRPFDLTMLREAFAQTGATRACWKPIGEDMQQRAHDGYFQLHTCRHKDIREPPAVRAKEVELTPSSTHATWG